MHKTFKYSVIAVEHPEQEITHEICFEKGEILHTDDRLNLEIQQRLIPFKITAVRKVDHVTTPNDQFDFRVFAVGLT